MHTTPVKIFFGAWIVWFLYLIAGVVMDPVWTKSDAASHVYGAVLGGASLVGIETWLAWRMYRRPRRSTTIWFNIICVILLWKFWVGVILSFMLPGMGGYSFGDAFAHWWALSFSKLRFALATFLPLPLVVVSISYWSAYCRERKGETIAHDAQPNTVANP